MVEYVSHCALYALSFCFGTVGRYENMKEGGVKFGLSVKHTKFEKNLPHGFDKSADLLRTSKPWGRFFQIMCASQKVRTLKLYPFLNNKFIFFAIQLKQ